MDQSRLAALEQGYMNTYGAEPQYKTPQKKKRNFWLDQISTGTGILGGIAGSLVTPVLGTGVGAGVGGALGEAIENIIDPKGGNWGNVAKEGALSAVMGAGPIKLLKGGAAGTKALLTGADDVVKVASKAAMTPLRQKAGQAVLGGADNLAIKNFRLTPTQLTNFQKKFGEDAGQVIRKYGFQNVDDITAKGIEPLQSQFDEAISGITGVTKESLKDSLMKRINKLSGAGPSDMKAIGTQLNKETSDLLKGFGDVIDAKELNVIRRQFDDLVNYTEKVANPSRYGVNKRMADGIRETLQKADPTGSLKDVGRELSKLRQLSEVASKQGNLGRGSLPLGLDTLMGAGVGGAAFGGPAAVGGALATKALNSNTGRRAAMAGAEKLGGKLVASGAKSAAKNPARTAATRLGVTGLANGITGQAPSTPSLEDALYDQSLENNAMSSIDPTSINPAMNANMMDSQYQNEADMSSPFSPQNVEANVQQILGGGGTMKDVKEYLGIVQTMQSLNGGGKSSKPLTGEARNRALKAQSGLRSLDTLEETLSRDPGAFQRQALPNPFGITGRLTGTTDIRAATDNVVDVIARMRSGAAITDEEAGRFARLLPMPGDSKESALRKLQNVRAELESYMQPDGGGANLEDAMMTAQYGY
jgi:hypothetical protein